MKMTVDEKVITKMRVTTPKMGIVRDYVFTDTLRFSILWIQKLQDKFPFHKITVEREFVK